MSSSLRTEREMVSGATGMALVLHGYGDEPTRLLRLMSLMDPHGLRNRVAPYGPVDASTGGPAWFPAGGRGEGLELASALGQLDDLVVSECEALSLDPGKDVAVVGHSQGAAMALSLACREGAPWRPAQVVAIAGWIPHEVDVSWDLGAATETRFLMAHGTEDSVVPVQMGRSSARALERAGADVTWYEHPGGHELPRRVLQVAREWLPGPELD